MQTLHRCNTWRVAVPIDRGFGTFLDQSFQPNTCQSGQLHVESVESARLNGASLTLIAAMGFGHFEGFVVSKHNKNSARTC